MNNIDLLKNQTESRNEVSRNISLRSFTMYSAQKFLKNFLSDEKRRKYLGAAALDFACIALILFFGKAPAQSLVSPLQNALFSNVSNVYKNWGEHEMFAFVPGHSVNKLDNVEFEKLSAIAFFDVVLDSDGTLARGSRGYRSFRGEDAASLFIRAKNRGVKSLLTVTQSDSDELKTILNDPSIQSRAIEDLINEVKETNIDGVVIDFEAKGSLAAYQNSFTNFVSDLTDRMHEEVPGGVVAVAVSSTLDKNQGLVNVKDVSEKVDRLLVMSYEYASPEIKSENAISPIWGAEAKSYWDDVTGKVGLMLNSISGSKVMAEVAWYGDGDKYPLYKPHNTADVTVNVESLSADQITPEMIERLVSEVPPRAQAAARRNIPYIIKALADEQILNYGVLSYALATIEHETAETFEPLEEYSGRQSARRLGYEGGTNYFGRGFIQLTHLRNYKAVGERIGMGDELVRHPELAATPEVAARILADFFKNNNIANLASSGNYIQARVPVNPDANGWSIAQLAWKYEGNI